MKQALQIVALPGILGGSLVVVYLALVAGRDHFISVSATIVGASLVVLALQRALPAVPEWRWWGPDAGVDVLHTLVSSGGASAAARALLLPAAIAAQGALSPVLGAALWPSAWPLAVQLVLALVLGDLGAYWLHRLSHTWAPLWRLHALHHSSERLYVLSSGRNHPVHTAMTWSIEVLPLVLLGAGPEVLALHATFTAVNGLLQHANIDLRPGPLNWLLSTCDLHRWHHSANALESRTNYGNNLIVWDHVFGTFHLPHGSPARVGLDDVAFPRDYLSHLASPLWLHRWTHSPSARGRDGL